MKSVTHSPVFRRIDGVLWWSLVGWTVLGVMSLMLGLGEGPLPQWFQPGEVADFLAQVTPHADFVWVLLGSLTVVLLLIRTEGGSSAAMQIGMILLTAVSIGWLGAITGFPFGARDYGKGLGPLLAGRLPYAMPLIVLIVVISARFAFAQWRRGRGWMFNSMGVGALAMSTALNMNFVADIRDYWSWREATFEEPGDMYWKMWYLAAWFLVGFTLNLFSAPVFEDDVMTRKSGKRLAIIFFLLNGALLSLHFARL